MQKAGVPLSKQRLCQPYGDDQRQGLWLYHILEPETWYKLIARVNGVNTGALYVEEKGNVAGTVRSPYAGHTWKSFTNLLLSSLPANSRDHYIDRFRRFIKGWKGRGYTTIPMSPTGAGGEAVGPILASMAKVLLRTTIGVRGSGRLSRSPTRMASTWKSRSLGKKPSSRHARL